MATTQIIPKVPYQFNGVFYTISAPKCSGQIIVNINESAFTEEQRKQLVGISFKFFVKVNNDYIPIDNTTYIWDAIKDESIIIEEIPDSCFMTVQAITVANSSTVAEFDVAVYFDNSGIFPGSDMPSFGVGDANKLLGVNGSGTSLEWKNPRALQPMKDAWESGNLTTRQAADLIVSDPDTHEGDGYLGGVYWSDLSYLGLGNAEVKAFMVTSNIVLFEMSSSDTYPYHWIFNSAQSDDNWRSYVPNPAGGGSDGQVLVYDSSLTSHTKWEFKPTINGVEVSGNKTLSNYGLDFSVQNEELIITTQVSES